jgi:hypothetical protein
MLARDTLAALAEEAGAERLIEIPRKPSEITFNVGEPTFFRLSPIESRSRSGATPKSMEIAVAIDHESSMATTPQIVRDERKCPNQKRRSAIVARRRNRRSSRGDHCKVKTIPAPPDSVNQETSRKPL